MDKLNSFSGHRLRAWSHDFHLYTWSINVEGEAPAKQSLHYLLTASQKTHEIMMSRLFKQIVCAIILEQIWENKAKQPLSELQSHTFVCLSAAIQMGPFKIKSFQSIPFSESSWTRGLVGAELLFFTRAMRLWCVWLDFFSFGVLSQVFSLHFRAKSAVYDGRGLIMDISM